MVKRDLWGNLRDLAVRLAKYSHAEGCNEIWVPPSYHSDCAEQLDLDTAIAYKVAKMVGELLDDWEIRKGENIPPDILLKLNMLERDVMLLLGIITLCQEKYSALRDLLMELVKVLFEREEGHEGSGSNSHS